MGAVVLVGSGDMTRKSFVYARSLDLYLFILIGSTSLALLQYELLRLVVPPSRAIISN
jgi:hypothetical protein